MAQVTRENSDIIGLPVYASRLFRFASFYVNRTKGIKTAAGPARQAHRRAGMGAHRRRLYARLADARRRCCAIRYRMGQAGTNEAGRIEKVELTLPKGVTLTPLPTRR